MRVFLFALCLTLPAAASAQGVFDPLRANCDELAGDYFAEGACKCGEIDSAVARLECFDKLTVASRFLQQAAALDVARLANSPFGRTEMVKWCRTRPEFE